MKHQSMKQILLPGIVGAVFVAAFVGIIGSALHSPRPHKLPVAVVAPAPAVAQIQRAADAKMPGALAIKGYTNAAEAQRDLHTEAIYGVIAPGATGVQATVSSALGEPSKQAVTAVAEGAAAAMRTKATVVDVTPQASGVGSAMVMMFLFLATTIAAVLGQVISRRSDNLSFGSWLTMSTVGAVLVGLTGATVAAMLSEFDGAFWGVTSALAACGFASAAILGGMFAALGQKGFGLTALLLIPLGVATSGALVNEYFLPSLYAGIAPYMLSSATIDAIRQAAYLDNSAVGGAYGVLAVWALIGVGLRALPKRKSAATPAK